MLNLIVIVQRPFLYVEATVFVLSLWAILILHLLAILNSFIELSNSSVDRILYYYDKTKDLTIFSFSLQRKEIFKNVSNYIIGIDNLSLVLNESDSARS